MAQRFEVADVTCPASTPSTAPVEVALAFGGGIVRRIHIVIPAGHAGLTGIALGYGHQPIIPRTGGRFISGDDDVLRMDFTDTVPGVAWSAFVCNLDLQPHVWEVRFELDEITDGTAPVTPAPIAVEDIEAAGAAALDEGS